MHAADYLESEAARGPGQAMSPKYYAPFQTNSTLARQPSPSKAYNEHCERYANTLEPSSSPAGGEGSYGPKKAVVPPANVFISGVPAYPWGTRGEYKTNRQQMYNGAPIYERSAGGYTWKLYRRASGRWVLDFDGVVSEDWAGTVNYAYQPTDTPFEAKWNLQNMAVGYPALDVTGDVHYAASYNSRGIYTIDPTHTHHGAPVYRRAGKYGVTWNLYRREYHDAHKWYLTFNTVGPGWEGTIHYAHSPTFRGPLEANWSPGWSDTNSPPVSMRVRLPAHSNRRSLQESKQEPGPGAQEGTVQEPAAEQLEETPRTPPVPELTSINTRDILEDEPELPVELEEVPDEDDGDAAREDATVEPHTVRVEEAL
jgi:hypothetical protein